eukprot:CAMPEP_0119395150 /NCGR_PEP_ID=MMETSP1334-20130426/132219_1 /TAXON_ID=127549 /ORGANISM="Calcidiscus leptoporus, Strain RCC1130" /LENGTH=41 /DNA_ID= /DNA_START= /DNA_END= /DNA_ORIENTATION=
MIMIHVESNWPTGLPTSFPNVTFETADTVTSRVVLLILPAH